MALNIVMINANIFASGFFVLFLKIAPNANEPSEKKLCKFVFFSLGRGVLVVTLAIVEAEAVFSVASEVLASLPESKLMFPPEYGQAGGVGPLFVGIVISYLL